MQYRMKIQIEGNEFDQREINIYKANPKKLLKELKLWIQNVAAECTPDLVATWTGFSIELKPVELKREGKRP